MTGGYGLLRTGLLLVLTDREENSRSMSERAERAPRVESERVERDPRPEEKPDRPAWGHNMFEGMV